MILPLCHGTTNNLMLLSILNLQRKLSKMFQHLQRRLFWKCEACSRLIFHHQRYQWLDDFHLYDLVRIFKYFRFINKHKITRRLLSNSSKNEKQHVKFTFQVFTAYTWCKELFLFLGKAIGKKQHQLRTRHQRDEHSNLFSSMSQ